MAKREDAPQKGSQKSLFEKPDGYKAERPSSVSMYLDRQKIDLKAKTLKDRGLPLFESYGYSIKCLICGNSSSNALYVKYKYCLNCDYFLNE